MIREKERKKGREVGESQTKGLALLGSASESTRSKMLKQKGDIGVELYHSFGWLAKDAIKGDLTRVYGSTTIAELQWIVDN